MSCGRRIHAAIDINDASLLWWWWLSPLDLFVVVVVVQETVLLSEDIIRAYNADDNGKLEFSDVLQAVQPFCRN